MPWTVHEGYLQTVFRLTCGACRELYIPARKQSTDKLADTLINFHECLNTYVIEVDGLRCRL